MVGDGWWLKFVGGGGGGEGVEREEEEGNKVGLGFE